MTALQTIKAELKAFTELQEQLKSTGATDDGPGVAFHRVLGRAIEGEDYLPRTVEDWSLCADESGKTDSAVAAAKLTKAADKIRKMIQRTQIGKSAELKRFLKNYCWRINW